MDNAQKKNKIQKFQDTVCLLKYEFLGFVWVGGGGVGGGVTRLTYIPTCTALSACWAHCPSVGQAKALNWFYRYYQVCTGDELFRIMTLL
jgi:hypothetical protein